MEEFPEDGAISFFEDLDPEPQAEQGQARKREFTIGVVLIMLVLVWVSSQWLRTQQEAKQYHSAQAAAATHDWQTAYALSNGVSDFSDASQRAAEAKKNLDERNTQYEKAREASGKGDWVTALQAARDVAQIQPGYFNSSVIAADAVSHLTDTALDGSVA